MDDDDDGRVGYGRPPKRTQFKPGVSGNPAGRPKRRPKIDDFLRELLDQPTTILRAGHQITVSGREAVAFTYFKGALKGDRDALRKVESVDQDGDDEELDGAEIAAAEDAEIVAVCGEQSTGTSNDADPAPAEDGNDDEPSG